MNPSHLVILFFLFDTLVLNGLAVPDASIPFAFLKQNSGIITNHDLGILPDGIQVLKLSPDVSVAAVRRVVWNERSSS